MSELLLVGESLVDVVHRAGDPGPGAEYPGGSPANVALGLARLGHNAHLLTWLGDDERGDRVRAHLEASGVHLVAPQQAGERTSTSTATLNAEGVAAYDFDLRWQVPDVPLPPALDVVHTGSIGSWFAPGAATVERIVHGAHGRQTVSFDPNVRPALLDDAASARAHVESLVAASDVVKVSDEDLAWLTPGEDVAEVAASWLTLGPAMVVVTMGGQGAFALSRSGRVDVAAPRIQVVDTVGAGDSFQSGLLDGLATAGLLGGPRRAALQAISTADLETAVRRAVRVSAVTCTRAGANPPTAAELADE